LDKYRFFLVFGSHLDQSRPHHPDGNTVIGGGRLQARHFLIKNDLFHQRGASAAIFFRPVQSGITRFVEFAGPVLQKGNFFMQVDRLKHRLAPTFRQILLEPLA
jgi:hypothetical protein